MKNVLLYVVLSCLLLACQNKGEALREKRIAEMEASYEKALQANAEDGIRSMNYEIRKGGSLPQGITSLVLVREIHEKTKQILTTLVHEPNKSISGYQAYLQKKMQDILDSEEKNRLFSNPIHNKRLYILDLEAYCLRKLGAYTRNLALRVSLSPYDIWNTNKFFQK